MKRLLDLAIGEDFELDGKVGQKQSGPLPAAPTYVLCYIGFGFQHINGESLVAPVV